MWHKECNVYFEIIWTKKPQILYGRCNQEPHVKVLQAGVFSVSQLSTIPIHNSVALHTSVTSRKDITYNIWERVKILKLFQETFWH